MLRTRIIGTGSFLPETIRTNFDMEKLCDTTDEWIQQRTGIKQRHVAKETDGASDLALPAAKRAIESAGIKAEEIDLIVVATISGDYVFPATGCIIGDGLGIPGTPTFDVNAACSGFMYGLATCDAFIRSGMYKTILLVASELASNRLNYGRRDTAVLFGDGAGAVVLRGEEGDAGILTTHLWADGSAREILWMPAGGSKITLTKDNIESDEYAVHMMGQELFKRAIVEFEDAINTALKAAGHSADEIDYFVPHQANVRILQMVAKRLGLPMEKMSLNIETVGNCIAASIPLALDPAVREGKIKEGDLVLFASFGAGLTWASSLVRW